MTMLEKKWKVTYHHITNGGYLLHYSPCKTFTLQHVFLNIYMLVFSLNFEKKLNKRVFRNVFNYLFCVKMYSAALLIYHTGFCFNSLFQGLPRVFENCKSKALAPSGGRTHL